MKHAERRKDDERRERSERRGQDERRTDHEKRAMIESINFLDIPFFHSLKKDHIQKLKPHLEVQQHKAGEVLFIEGDPGDCLYIIIKGIVKVFIDKGGAQSVATLGRNESFGEMALLSGAPRSASVQAFSDLTVLKLSKDQFDEIAQQNKSLSIHFAGLLSKRLAATQHEVYEPKLSSKEVQASMQKSGLNKAMRESWQVFFLAVLAGIYISIGGHAYLVTIEQGMGKIIGGAVFGIGLILVVIAEAELFTGNIIMMVGLLSSLYNFKQVVQNMWVVFLGNFIGSSFFVLLILSTGLLFNESGTSSIGQLAIKVAESKLSLSFTECLVRGFLCNMLVILAIMMSLFAKDIISKIFCCILPVMVFVASGFEHCVANMYLIPIGLFAKGASMPETFIMFKNIIPVTLGNILGGLFILLIHPTRIKEILNKMKKIKLSEMKILGVTLPEVKMPDMKSHKHK